MKRTNLQIVGGIAFAVGIMLLFYTADRVSGNSEGNWLRLSFFILMNSYAFCVFSVILAIAFFVRRYFNVLLITIGITLLSLDAAAQYLLGDYETMRSFLLSSYLYPDLLGILLLVIVLYFHEKRISRKR